MVILRCTRKLLSRLGAKASDLDAASETLLGDWYANVLFGHGPQLILAVNESSRLPVLLPAAPLATLAERSPTRSQVF